jgi:ABC-type transport system involved in multi-copper enzyme maturation permease subunit
MKALLNYLNKHWVNKIIVGVPITLIFLFVFLGVDGTTSLLLASIVCTAGIGLVFWLGIAMVVGWILTIILQSFYSDAGQEIADKPDKSASYVPVTDAETNLIVNYIQDARNYGFKDNEIREKLTNTGWSDEKINGAFVALNLTRL